MGKMFGHWTSVAIALYALHRFPGSGISSDNAMSFLKAALALNVANTVLRPFMYLASFPLLFCSFGIPMAAFNGGVLYAIPQLVPGFHVANFHGAMVSSVTMGVITWVFGLMGRGRKNPRALARQAQRMYNLPQYGYPNYPNNY